MSYYLKLFFKFFSELKKMSKLLTKLIFNKIVFRWVPINYNDYSFVFEDIHKKYL